MSITVAMHIESRCLHVVAKGRFALAAAQRSFVDILDVALQNRVFLILLDGRQVSGEPSTIDRFFYAKFAALSVTLRKQRHGNIRPKFAYVLKAPVLDPKRFGETVALNRGMNVKVFETVDAARAWLGLPAAEAAAARNT